MLKIAVIGRPTITLDDQPVSDFVSDKALVLLCYLAIERRPHSRTILADLLWGEMEPERAKANLRMALYNLQKLLPDRFLTDRKTAALDPATPTQLDLDQLLTAADDPDTPLDALAAAARLIRGPFMAGIDLSDTPELEEWLRLQRETSRLAALDLLDRLAQAQIASGNWEAAAAATRRLIEIEPWHEEAHRRLMRLLARTGRLTAALAQYDTCRRLLADEMGIEPMAETTALYERIRASRRRPRAPQLPRQPRPFVGREVELGRLFNLLADPHHRLVSITGPGGQGKTRFALAGAEANSYFFFDGVVFVPLAGVVDEAGILTALAAALRFNFSQGGPPKQQLFNFLRPKEMLLILDNFEHLMSSADLVAELLQEAPHLQLLLTSRERLNLRWETHFPLGGLAYPTRPLTTLPTFDAPRLFADVAHRIRPDFDLGREAAGILHICRLVDGAPLALELAAALVDRESCSEIAARIAANADILTSTMRDVPARHRSQRAVFDHSWALLSTKEQAVFKKLSVFRGGFDQPAAAAIAGADSQTLEALAAKSLLQREGEAGRFNIHELLRQYAGEMLTGDPTAEKRVQTAHSRFFTTWLAARTPFLFSGEMPAEIQQIRPDLDNIRLAWRTAADTADLPAIEEGLVGLARYFEITSLNEEGAALLQVALDTLAAKNQVNEQLTARMLAEQLRFLIGLGQFEKAITNAETVTTMTTADEILALTYQKKGHTLAITGRFEECQAALSRGIELAQTASLPHIEGGCHNTLGVVYMRIGQRDLADESLSHALALYADLGDLPGQAAALGNLGVNHNNRGMFDQGKDFMLQALKLFEQIDNRQGQAGALINLASVTYQQGEPEGALELYDQALTLLHDIGGRAGEGMIHSNMADIFAARYEFVEASYHVERALAIFKEDGETISLAQALGTRGSLAIRQHDYERAGRSLEEALRIRRDLGERSKQGDILFLMAGLAWFMGEPELVLARGQEALEAARSEGERSPQGFALTLMGHALTDLGRYREARTAFEEALALRRELDQPHFYHETLAGLARTALAERKTAEAGRHVAEIIPFLRKNQLTGTSSPIHIYMTCFDVLSALGQAEQAEEMLQLAHELLQRQAAGITDEALRRHFLEEVPLHRRVIERCQD